MSPHDPTSPTQPLDADERALAERLARIGPHGEPSPALDSKILSAAHAAVGNPSGSGSRHRGTHGKGPHGRSADSRSTTRQRRRPRWPLGLGIAASMVLAIGLAWQMRPLPNATPAYRSEADSALASASVETKQAAEPATRMVAPAQSNPVAPPPSEPLPAEPLPAEAGPAEAKPIGTRSTEDAAMAADEDAAANREQGAPAMSPQAQERMQEQQTGVMKHEPEPQSALSTPPPPQAPAAPPAPRAPVTKPVFTTPMPPIVFDAPSPIDLAHPITDTAATTAPATTNESLPASSADKIAASQAETRAEAAAQAAAAAASKTSTDARRQAARASAPTPAQPKAFKTLSVAGAADNEMPTEDVPPATVASPLVRDAWLARIRTLATQGRAEEARASLRVFVLRYPGYLLPIDLRTLLGTTPDSTSVDGPAADGATTDP